MSYCLNPACPKPQTNGANFCTACGTKLLLDNRYRAIALLSTDGIGKTFLAVDESNPSKKKCAIEQFLPGNMAIANPASYQEAIELFNQECKMLDKLGDKSPCIPSILGYFEQNKHLYLVQEFINGQNLHQELKQLLNYSEAQIYQFLNDLLPILKLIHQENVIHRNIKPDNIIRDRNNQLAIINFGLSKQLKNILQLDAVTRGFTLGYAPPEQMTRNETFPASDIYSVGVTCIYLMTGITPDELYNSNERRWIWLEKLISREVAVSSKLKQILEKMLMDDYRERYQSVSEVINDLFPATAAKLELVVAQTSIADYQTIGEAIQNAQPGTRIVVHPGVYKEGLVIDKPLEIIGSGIEDTIIQSTDSNCILMQTDSATVRNLTLQGSGGQQGNSFFAVDIPQGQLILEDSDITSDSLSAIAIHGYTAKPIIRRCKIHDGKESGVYIWDNGQGLLENCDIFANSTSGVAISEGGNPQIRNCKIHDDSESGVSVWDKGKGTLENCEIFANAGSGVEIKQGGNPQISNCKIYDGQVNGVYVWDKGQGILENCDIFSNATSGVAIAQGGNPLIRNCKIYDGKTIGVMVWDNGRGILENCDIFTNIFFGVAIAQGGNPIIFRCRINKNKLYAVYVHSQGKGVIQNSDMTDNENGAWFIESGCSVKHTGNKEYKLF